MNIEEKVTEITEKLAMLDVQKVYDAGYAKGREEGGGGGGSTNPTFRLRVTGSNKTYYLDFEFEEGMTWGEWINSEYNNCSIDEYMGSASYDCGSWTYRTILYFDSFVSANNMIVGYDGASTYYTVDLN